MAVDMAGVRMRRRGRCERRRQEKRLLRKSKDEDNANFTWGVTASGKFSLANHSVRSDPGPSA